MNPTFYTTVAHDLVAGEARLQTLQQRLGTGKRVNTVSDNPAAFIAAARSSSGITQLNAETGGQTLVSAKLSNAVSALNQASTVLNAAQSIALNGITGTTSTLNYPALADQMGQNLQQLISLANTQSQDGNFAFSGTARNTRPFTVNGSGSVSYVGHGGSSSVTIAPGINVDSSLTGSVFMDALSGNGYASVSAKSGNTGSATVLAAGVLSASKATAFRNQATPIKLAFTTSSTGVVSYKATQGGTTLGTGSLPANANASTITVAGIEFKVNGAPANGDSFTISPARPQPVFSVLKAIQTALQSPGSTAAQRARTRQKIGNSLNAIIQYQHRFSATAARAGVVLRTVKRSASTDQQLTAQDTNNVNQLTAANEPKTITSLSQQTSALQAAMKAFATTSQLSLFSYIK